MISRSKEAHVNVKNVTGTIFETKGLLWFFHRNALRNSWEILWEIRFLKKVPATYVGIVKGKPTSEVYKLNIFGARRNLFQNVVSFKIKLNSINNKKPKLYTIVWWHRPFRLFIIKSRGTWASNWSVHISHKPPENAILRFV